MGIPTDAGSVPGRGMMRWLPAAGMGACPAHPDSPGEPRPAGETPAGARRCQRWTLTVVCLASALLLFNVTAPNVALPAIAADLGADFAAQQWVLSAYALVLASLLLAGGALGDRYGRRRAFLLGLAVFGLGSLGCALAPSPALLIAGRVLQGLGAAALFPSGLALIAAEFTGAARARAIGVWGACVSGAIALGPLIGGLLVQVSGWRAEFVFGVVLVVPAAAVGLRHLRESRDRSSARLDWVGTGLLTGALVLLIVLVQRGSAIGWGSPVTIGMAAASAVLFAAFVVVEFRIAAPLIAPELMRNPTFVGATVIALVFAAAGFAPLVYVTLFLLQVVGSGPTLAGLQVAPFAVASLVVSLLAARVAGRIGVRATLAGGLVLCGAGLGLLLVLAPDSGGLALLPGLVVFGVGAGLVNPTMTVAALGTVDAGHSGMASGVNNTARQIGIAAGIAGFGAVLQAGISGGVSAGMAARGVPAAAATEAGRLAAAGDLPGAGRALGAAGPALPGVYDAAFTSALHTVFIAAIAIVALGVLLTVALVRPARAAGTTSPEPAPCTHLNDIVEGIEPSTPEGCAECLREGRTWVNLRMCLRCGHVGCCDDSPGRHAGAHWHTTRHPLVRSLEPGEEWLWCYADEVLLAPQSRQRG
jgi:EmrB/QacA subfamily drug resistance transporter